MKFLTAKKSVALAASVVVVAIAAVGAYAYFTSTGSGTGSGTVGTSTAWQVDTDAYAGGPLTPAGDSGTYETVDYRVTNNSTGQQALAKVNIKVATTVGANPNAVAGVFSNAVAFPSQPACTGADFELSVDGGTNWYAGDVGVDDTALAENVGPGDTTSSDGTITIRMIDTGFNQDNCKTLSVPLFLLAS